MSAVRYRTEPLTTAAALHGSTTRRRPRTLHAAATPPAPEPATETTDLLKPTEVAQRLKVSRSWVYDAAADGRLPSIRLGAPDGPLRFVRADLEQWIEDARARAMERFA